MSDTLWPKDPCPSKTPTIFHWFHKTIENVSWFFFVELLGFLPLMQEKAIPLPFNPILSVVALISDFSSKQSCYSDVRQPFRDTLDSLVVLATPFFDGDFWSRSGTE